MERSQSRRADAQSWLQASPRLLKYAIVLLTGAIFIADLQHPQVVALSALYAIPILFSLWLERRRYTIVLAIVCAVLALIDLFVGEKGASTTHVVINRATALLAIGIVTSLGLMRLRTERELRYVRKIALTTLRSLGEAVITVNRQGQVRFVNRAAEQLLALRRGDLLGQPLESVFHVDDERPVRMRLIDVAEHGAASTTEGLLRTHDGRRCPIEITRTAIQSRTGEQFGHVLVFRDNSARKEHEEAMRRMAYRDELTGLPNRTALADRMTLELAHAKRNRESLAVLYVDLDGFKEVNDRYEHAAGDALLVQVAERFRGALRAGDTIARLGGDEFVVLLPGIAGTSDARRVGDKLIASLKAPMSCLDHELVINASIGIATYPKDGVEAETLMRRADKAMYRAKQLGRGRVEQHASSSESSVR